MGKKFKTKIHYPTVETQERIINPPKGNQKKTMRERERVIIFWCGKYGLNEKQFIYSKKDGIRRVKIRGR